MARPLWTGSVSFGLVNIPVKLFTAQRDHKVAFHQLHRQTGNRIRNKRVDEGTGREVDGDDIVKGYELESGGWVTFSDDEIEELRPRSTRTLDIEDFVELAEIDPVFYERTYYLAPADDEGAARAYALLLAAMEQRGRAGIGRVVMRNTAYLAAIRPVDGVLALSTMRFADEVLDPADAGIEVDVPKVDAKTRKVAESLIDALEGPFDPAKYHDTYTEELRDLIERKAQGEVIEPEVEEEGGSAEVVDLMEALRASVEGAKGRRSGRSTSGRSGRAGGAAEGGGGKRRSAKKAAPKRAAAKKAGSTKKAGSAKKAGSKKAAAKKRASRKAA